MANPHHTAQLAVDPTTPSKLLAKLYVTDPDLRPRLATNPALPGDLLRELGSTGKAHIRRRVAANPNTPPDLLLQLAAHFPRQFLNNPIFPLLLLENPLLFSEIPRTTLCGLLKMEEMPEEFLAWAAESGETNVIKALLRNPRVTKEMLVKMRATHRWLAEQIDHHVGWDGRAVDLKQIEITLRATTLLALPVAIRQKLAQNPDTPVEYLEYFASDPDSEVRKAVAGNPSLPQTVIDLLVRAGSTPNFCNFVDPDPSMSVEELEHLAQSGHWAKILVIRHPNTPISVADQLATHSGIGEAMAGNPGTSAKILEQLATHRDLAIRTAVASNPSTPINILDQFATHGDLVIRQAMAANNLVPEEILIQLATDNDAKVRLLVANHPRRPQHLIDLLVRAGSTADLRNLGYPDLTLAASNLEYLCTLGHWARWLAALHPNTPVATLEALCRDSDEPVFTAAVAHPALPVNILQVLAADTSHKVHIPAAARLQSIASDPGIEPMCLSQLAIHDLDGIYAAVVRNPMAPPPLLAQLTVPKSLRKTVAQHPYTPIPLLLALSKQGTEEAISRLASLACNPLADRHLLEELATHRATEIRTAVANNPQAPVEILEKLSADRNLNIRLAVASNPHTPVEVLVKLSTEKVAAVRGAVVNNPNRPQSLINLLIKAGSSPTLQELTPPDPSVLPQELAYLSTLGHWARLLAARHPNAPAAILEKLSTERDLPIREAVASHRYTPVEVLERLASSNNSRRIRHAISSNPSTPLEFLAKIGLTAVASHPGTSVETLVQLAHHRNWQVRVAVARNPSSPAELLTTLAASSSWQVCAVVATNPNTPTETLVQLATEPDLEIPKALLTHPHLPEPVIAALASSRFLSIRSGVVTHASVTSKVLIRSTHPEQRLLGMLHPDCPVGYLVRNARRDDWRIRFAIAIHPNTPPNTLKILARDGDRRVQTAAARRLA